MVAFPRVLGRKKAPGEKRRGGGKKWWLLVIALALIVVCLHSPLVERPMAKQMIAFAGNAGYELSIADLEFFPFALIVRLRGLAIDGPGLHGTLEEIDIDGDAGLLLGRWSLDGVSLRRGRIVVGDLNQLFAGQQGESSGEIPKIHLGQAEVSEVTVVYRDRANQIDGKLRDFELDYAQPKLSAAFELSDLLLGGRRVKHARFFLKAHTQSFDTFSELELGLASDASSFLLQGTVEDGLRPYLSWHADIGADITGMDQPIVVSGALRDRQVACQVSTSVVQAGQRVALEAETDFELTAQFTMPITFRIDDFCRGSISVSRDQDDVYGDFSVHGNPQALNRLLPQVKAARAALNGRFRLPGGEIDALDAQWWCWLDGTPRVEGQGWVTGRHADFWFHLEKGNDICGEVRGNYDGDLSLTYMFDGRESQIWSRWLGFDPALTWGEWNLAGGLDWSGQTVTFHPSRLLVHDVMRPPSRPQDMTLEFGGDWRRLQGQITFDDGAGGFGIFELDVKGRTITFGCAELDQVLDVDTQSTAQVFVNTQLSGPWQAPQGWAKAFVDLPDAVLPGGGRAFAHLRRDNDWIELLDLDAQWGALSASGSGRVATDLARWDLRMVMRSEAPQDTDLPSVPEFTLNVSSDESRIGAALSVPEQEVRRGSTVISMGTEDPLAVDVPLHATQLFQLDGGFFVAGIKLSEMRLGVVSEDRFETSFRLDLTNAEYLRRAFADSWPEGLDVNRLSASITASTDAAFSCPELRCRTDVAGTFRGYPWAASDVSLGYVESWYAREFDGIFAGVVYRCMAPEIKNQTVFQALDAVSPNRGDEDFEFFCEFEVFDGPSLVGLFDMEGLASVRQLNGVAQVTFSSGFQKLDLGVGIASLDGVINSISVATDALVISYDGGWHVQPAILKVGDLPMDLTETENGFQLDGMISMMQIRPFLEGAMGDAWFDVNLEVLEAGEDFDARLRLKQERGSVILPDPWLEITDWSSSVTLDWSGAFSIEEGRTAINGGPVILEGNGRLFGPSPQLDIEVLGYDVPVDIADVLATWTFSLRYTKEDDKQDLQGAILCRDGYYGHRGALERIVRDLLAEVPAIYFPDPILSAIDVQVSVQTQTPLIVDQQDIYLELESPSILVRGTLAEPALNSGSLFIAEGSEVSIGNETLVFQASQIQFHPNRPNEPYLQIYMEYGDFGDRKPIQMLGYLSDLEQNLESGEMAAFLANYLLGRVSSLVSLESETNETAFDTSFTVVLSQPLTRKVVTRYAVPLNRQTEQRFELGLGPYAGNLVNLIYSQNETSLDWRHQSRLGKPAEIAEKVKRINWTAPDTFDRKQLAKQFKMKKGDVFSQTRLRRAVVDLERLLAESGYLEPTIETEFDASQLRVSLDPGPRTDIRVSGLDIPQSDRRDMLRLIKNGGSRPVPRLKTWLMEYLVRRGYRDGSIHVELVGRTYQVDINHLQRLGQVRLDLGPAAEFLPTSVGAPKVERELLQDYLISPTATTSLIRARLAARGFVNPDIDNGFFVRDDLFWIPIELGPRAELTRVTVNPNPVVDQAFFDEFTNQPFDYQLLQRISAKLSQVLTEKGKATLSPMRENGDVAVDVEITVYQVPRVEALDIQGNDRIDTDKVLAFLDFSPGMTQTAFNKAQERLIGAGPFRAARLFGGEGSALLELEERNRWDIDYGLEVNEREELTLIGQFRDRMFFKGFNDLLVRAEVGEFDQEVSAQAVFRRIWNSPFDFYTRASWDETSRDDNPEDLPSFLYLGALERRLSFPENRRIVFEFRYPFFRHHELKLGWEFWRIINHDVIKYYDDLGGEEGGDFDESLVFDQEESQTVVDLSPIKLTWVYHHLDHKTNPKFGSLASFSIEYFLDALGSGDQVDGIRLAGSHTRFHTWGALLWSHRIKTGWYKPKIALQTVPSEQDPVVFYLGGPTTLRGYDHNQAGVYSPSDEVWVGGEAMFFMSEELTYMTPWFGLGVTPFVDAGRVWPQIDDIDFSDLLVSAGLGLSWDSPLGYIRLDWATRIKEDVPEGIANDPREDWHFRFGRTF